MRRLLRILPLLLVLLGPAQVPAHAEDTVAPPTAGTYLFASDAGGCPSLYLVDEQGALTNLSAGCRPDWHPVLSRDGREVAFASRRDGNSEIYVMPLAGGDATNLTSHPAADYEPDWSPDGSHVVFVSERDNARDIYTLDRLSGSVHRLTHSGPGSVHRSPAWSPDGGSIAYSSVRDGVEHVYVLELGGGERQITRWPLKGGHPAWSDGGRLAFVGWDSDNRSGIYVRRADGSEVRLVWESEAAIGGLTWVGESIGFTIATDGGHAIYLLSPASGEVTPLVTGEGWNACLTTRAAGGLAPVTMGGREPEGGVDMPPVPVRGVNIASLGNTYLVPQLGFGWIKNYLSWGGVEPAPGHYNWQDPDNVVRAARRAGVQVLMRVHDTPPWLRPPGSSVTYPASDLALYHRFLSLMAWRYRGQIAAYEIGNEPNLAFDWGGLDPDPVRYARMLRVAHHAIKAADPRALVISGGLATTGDGGAGAMGDLDFLRAMYRAGARGSFDALGSHPYGYGLPPYRVQEYGLSVSRLLQQRQVMEEFGDGDTPIWVTETGWPLGSYWAAGEHAPFTVSEMEQAYYYQQLYLMAAERWPWLEAIFLFNLDFSTVPWYESQQVMRWFAILEGDGSPRLAFTWLRELDQDVNVAGAPAGSDG